MKLYQVMFVLLFIPLFLTAQTTDVGKPRKVVNDGSINAGQSVFWSKDTVYVLDGFVYAEAGAVLTIQAGTVIKALETPSTSDIASALIISRGARIYAEGTASEPIIFTSEYDSVALVDYDPNDGVDYVTDRGLWGGVVVLGRGVLNIASEALVEGLPNDPRAFYGGNDDSDNSGVIRYVSIRYTGITVEANKELQGLTMGCVGSGTVVEYVESFNSDDDGFEFFGGTVNTRYLVSAFNSDDSYDYDHGFRGKGQFWFAIQKGDDGNRLGEYDSGDAGSLTATPLAQPVIYNVTYIGSGASSGNTLNDFGLIYKEYGGGEHYNGIFMDFRGQAVKVDSGAGETSYNRLLNGGIKLENNIWFKAPGVTLSDMVGQKFVRHYLVDKNNYIVNPQLRGVSRTNNNGLDPRPSLGSPAMTSNLKQYPVDPFFTPVNYMGAFDPASEGTWIEGWTALSQNNIVGRISIQPTTDVGKPRKVVNDGSINAGQSVFWSKDTVYVLDGFVYAEAGAVLTIQAGTVIKALETPSTSDIASALIISRGARIYAEGTASEPIIFTSEYDSVALVDYDPNDGVDYVTDRGLWGGVVVLGRGVLNIASEALVEGLPNDPRAFYGGNDDSDNSGVIRYVSIRYTGITVEANKELQGLTMGCVGSGTVVEYVESFNSDDDGFEFFGGTVNTRYLVSAFNSDDSYDYDHGFRGKGQFWFAIQKGDDGNRLGEYDSGDAGSLTATPLAQPVIYNVTYIGSGASSGNTLNDFGLIYKEYGGGEHYNGIFMDFRGQAVKVDSGAGETSYNRLLNGGIKLENNIWFKAPGVTLSDMVGQKFLQTYLAGANNLVADPLLSGISRENNNGLDPRPVLNGPAYTASRKPYPSNDPFFKEVDYIGAFGKENWMDKWTALSHNNIIGNIFTSIESKNTLSAIQSYELLQNYPNPFNPETQIIFILPKAGKISLAVYNVLGEKIASLADGYFPAGTHRFNWNASNLASGIYFYQLQTDSQVMTRKMMLMK